MNKRGKIYTYTVINVASEEFVDQVPYAVAVVDDGENKFFTRIENYRADREIKIGMEVEFSRYDENQKPLYKLVYKN